MKSPFAFPLLIALAALPAYAGDMKTLRSFGAVGDGKTDDRAAIQRALQTADGATIDGEGKTYAVHGNVESVGVPVDFRNATLVQTMERLDVSKYLPSAKGNGQIKVDPPEGLIKTLNGLPFMSAAAIGTYAEDPTLSGADLEKVTAFTGIRTLSVGGGKDKIVPVRLEKIKIVRGQFADAGHRNASSGLVADHAGPLDLIDVEVTGDGKGRGITVSNCDKAKLLRVNVHDIRWALFMGDVNLPLESVKKDFGWNNFPIYEYRSALKKFVRVRIQEQLSGIFVQGCNDVTIEDTKVSHLETLIEGKPYAIQADGMTISGVKGLLIKNTDVSFVWEGIDFTGAGGSDYVYENVRTEDCFSFGLKLAHPKQNGKLTGCVVTRSGNAGFEIEPGVDNVEFVKCQAIDTGSTGFWGTSDGFRITGGGKPSECIPTKVHFIDCSAINKNFPGAMAHGFLCPPAASAPELQNAVTNCVVEGAKGEPISGFPAK